MITKIQAALDEISSQFADKRTQLCQLEVFEIENGRVTLTGTVLDAATLTAVVDQLQAHFPGRPIDSDDITILRQTEAQQLTVVTTITGLYNEPGFRSEAGSEVRNGARLELLQEAENWVFVRQSDGYLGWVYRPYLADETAVAFTHLVSEPVASLREAPDKNAALVNRVLAGTAVVVLAQQSDWRQIKLAGGQTGWLPADHLRLLTALPGTAADQREQLLADAFDYIGVPYLWAGTSAYGIDCSGYVQLLHQLSGLTLPRDADMQFAAGRPVEEPFVPGDLFFFGSDQGHRRISHVGMSIGDWQMIHASRSRNGVFVDDVQAVAHLRQTFIGARSFLNDNGNGEDSSPH